MKKLASLAVIFCAASALAEPVVIDGGAFQSPLVLDDEIISLPIASFKLDATQVSNRDFQKFVAQNPQWQRGNVPGIFSDANYLSHWQSPLVAGEAINDLPVTRVSWYAARAYCESQGGRLPGKDEWEYVSQQIRQLDGINDKEYARNVFAWYSNPNSENLKAVGSGTASTNGIHDLHGLVNEWVEDFQLLMSNGDDADLLSSSCGDTARFMANYDTASYATFFRYQSRSNYQPHTTTSTLGFRCAWSL